MASINHIQSWLASMKRSPTWQVLIESAQSAISGAAFGAALTAAGVHLPEVIVNQFRLKDFGMFQVFTVALGSSAFVILVLDRLKIRKRQVRPATSLGLFSIYDGNIIGGTFVGIGMSMSGSCPGTVTAQLAQGVPTAVVTATGGLLGGMAHIWVNRPSRRSRSSSLSRRTPRSPPPSAGDLSPTITSKSGIAEPAIYVLLASIWVALLYISSLSTAPFWRTQGAGGLYLGSAQLISLLLTSSTLGASGIYDQAGRYVWRLLGRSEVESPPTPPKSLLFAIGAVVGSRLLTSSSIISYTPQPSPVSLSSALVGGFVMAYGAKVAKGCTSGHGLSGLGALSFSSLISVASMFGAGIAYQFLA